MSQNRTKFTRELEFKKYRLGGIDVNILCLNSYDEIFNRVRSKAFKFRESTAGYALGSGNSIAGYVPVEGFMSMIDAAKAVRNMKS